MSEVQLPEGWVWKTLTDVVGRKGVFCDGDWVESKDQDEHGDVRLIQLADVGDGFFRDKSHRFLTHQKAVQLGCTFLAQGDVLVARMPDPLGRACIFPLPGEKKYVTVVDVCIIRTTPELTDNRFLTYWINTPQIRSRIDSLQSGSTRKRISRKNLSQILFPLPPLPVQHQIVARIEELFSELDAGVKELKTALARLKTYRQAVLHHYLNNPDWERVKLGDLALRIRNGISVKPNQDHGLKILRISAIRPNQVYQNEVRFLEDKPEYKAHILEDGDLLFTRYNGNVDFTGVCAVFRLKTNEPVTHPDKLIRVVLDTNLCNPDFVSYTANSGESRNFVRSRIRTTAGQSGISGGDVKSIPIHLPDLATQNQIVSEIEARLSEADAMETTIRQELARAENLRQSILKQAFSGKLVTAPVTPIPDEELAEVSEPVSAFYGSPSGDQLTLF